tara:strand:+ start:2153 stop:2782 length:630 start_codon:yes stop_codon:yes gene_type:complete
MSVKDYIVRPTTIQEVRPFIEQWHYSENVNGLRITHVFGLYKEDDENLFGDTLIGAMIYGGLAMASVWKKYGEVESDVVELRRLCCIDDTPKNTESYFIGQTLRWLKKNTDYKVVVSYADSNYNHTGTIYQATNFEYHGMTANGRVIDFEGKHYHDKTIRTYYTDKYGVKKLKPYAQKVRDALESGQAKYVETTGKHIYLFKLKKRGKK